MCLGPPFPWGRCGFVGKYFHPLPHAPRKLCHTIQNCGWEKMDCSLPSHSVVLLWMASSDPDDKPGGRRLPAAASGPLADGQALRFPAWVPSDVSHASSVCEHPPSSAGYFYTKSFWTRRTGRFLPKKWILCFAHCFTFCSKMPGSKGI